MNPLNAKRLFQSVKSRFFSREAYSSSMRAGLHPFHSPQTIIARHGSPLARFCSVSSTENKRLLLGPGRIGCNLLLGSNRIGCHLWLGPGRIGRSETEDEKWDDLLARIISHRLHMNLKRRCDKSRKCAVNAMEFMEYLHGLKCKLVYVATGEEDPSKTYNSDTASKALGQILGALLLGAFFLCVRLLSKIAWAIHKKHKANLELEQKLERLEEAMVGTADVASSSQAKEIMIFIDNMEKRLRKNHDEDMEEMEKRLRKKHDEDMEEMKKSFQDMRKALHGKGK